MSIRVDLGELQQHAAVRPFAYLLTTNDDARPHAIAVSPAFVVAPAGGDPNASQGTPDHLEVDAAGRTARNATARPHVSLVWPPDVEGGYSLVVDADAVVADDPTADSGVRIGLRPTSAVLHRPAPPAGGETTEAEAAGRGSDCTADCIRISLS
jgi:hypothetical protein